jgi:hypothetical protein
MGLAFDESKGMLVLPGLPSGHSVFQVGFLHFFNSFFEISSFLSNDLHDLNICPEILTVRCRFW